MTDIPPIEPSAAPQSKGQASDTSNSSSNTNGDLNGPIVDQSTTPANKGPEDTNSGGDDQKTQGVAMNGPTSAAGVEPTLSAPDGKSPANSPAKCNGTAGGSGEKGGVVEKNKMKPKPWGRFLLNLVEGLSLKQHKRLEETEGMGKVKNIFFGVVEICLLRRVGTYMKCVHEHTPVLGHARKGVKLIV